MDGRFPEEGLDVTGGQPASNKAASDRCSSLLGWSRARLRRTTTGQLSPFVPVAAGHMGDWAAAGCSTERAGVLEQTMPQGCKRANLTGTRPDGYYS